MLNTFDNAESFHKRRLEREHHLANMDSFSKVIEHNDEVAVLSMVDALSGFPLAKKQEEQKISKQGKKNVRMYGLSVVATVALAIASVLISTLGGIEFEEKAIQVGAVDPAISHASGPRFQRIFSLVLDWGFTMRSQLEDHSSPSRKALDWLVEDDTSIEDVEDIRRRYALATLYFGTQNESAGFVWDNSMHWLSQFPVCLWHGVYCHEDEWIEVGRVGGLNLSSNDLIGSLPEEIGLLDLEIHSLDVSNNYITGTIPMSIGLLKNLKDLRLGPNLLTGTVPSVITQINSLQHFYIDDCILTGTIPTEIVYLTGLQGVGLQQNALTGTIPPRLTQLSELVILYLDENALTGTLPLFPTSLIDLRLRSNVLTGSIPSQLGLLSMLQTCYLDTNRLVQTIPGELAKVEVLQELHLYNNQLTGSLPSTFGQLDLIRILYVDGNRLGGTLAPELGLMGSLESIFIFNNLITGPLPPSFALLSRLQQLVAHTNAISGMIPNEFGLLGNLNVLMLHENALTGTVPKSLGDLHLTRLELHSNEIEGEIPMEICKVTKTSLRNLTADCAEDTAKVTCICCSACY